MIEDAPNRGTTRRKRMAWAIGVLAVGAVSGGVLALTTPASAAPSASPTATSAPADPGTPGAKDRGPGGGGQRSDETVLTGADATRATAAALAAVPGGTVDRVETDADGAVYEAHMTKSDGTKVTVKFDKNFAVTAVQDGMGSHQ